MSDRRATGQHASSPLGLTIRRCATDDIPLVRAFMLRIFQEDYGYGYQPQWHWDYDDIQGVYLDNPRHVLFVVVEDATGEIVGTAGIRAGGPRSTTLPRWLLDRYEPPERTAQVVRVFIHPDHRRRGIARRLVAELSAFVQSVGDFEHVCLHTENAVDFWQAMGCKLILDGRTGDPFDGSVHFELPPAAE